jgi:hypothetical protein
MTELRRGRRRATTVDAGAPPEVKPGTDEPLVLVTLSGLRTFATRL